MTPQETWRPIPGWPAYEASDLGRVRSLDRVRLYKNGTRRVKGRVLKPWTLPAGYLYVHLSDGEAYRKGGVHILVAEAFIGPAPEGKPEIRHLNGDPADNRPANLRWGDRSENMQDTLRHGTHWIASRDHCQAGHEYTPENTELGRNATGTYRRCITCRRRWAREKAERDRLKRSA